MTFHPKPVSPQQLLQLAHTLSPAELRWLRDALDRVMQRTEPKADARAMLEATFGLWADRDDLPADGVDYVTQLRRSSRWDDLEPLTDETD
jgi:hypothetical protein